MVDLFSGETSDSLPQTRLSCWCVMSITAPQRYQISLNPSISDIPHELYRFCRRKFFILFFFWEGGLWGNECVRGQRSGRGCSSLRNTCLQTGVRIDRTELSILPTSFLLRFYSTATERLLVKRWQPLRLCSSIVQLSSCLSADILMHQTEQRRGSFTAAGRALIGHGNVCKPWRKSMAEGRNSRKRLWEQLFLQRRGGWRSELVDPSGGSEQLFGEAESSFLNRSNAERGKG